MLVNFYLSYAIFLVNIKILSKNDSLKNILKSAIAYSSTTSTHIVLKDLLSHINNSTNEHRMEGSDED